MLSKLAVATHWQDCPSVRNEYSPESTTGSVRQYSPWMVNNAEGAYRAAPLSNGFNREGARSHTNEQEPWCEMIYFTESIGIERNLAAMLQKKSGSSWKETFPSFHSFGCGNYSHGVPWGEPSRKGRDEDIPSQAQNILGQVRDLESALPHARKISLSW